MASLHDKFVRVLVAIGLGVLSLQATAQSVVNGDTQYHTTCTACHNTDPSKDAGGGSFPAPALNGGGNAAMLQADINGSMGTPDTDGLHSTGINATVLDIAAYLADYSYATASFSPTSHAFGSLLTTATASLSITVSNATVSNEGHGLLHVSGLSLTDSTNFSVSGCSAAVPAGSNCTITLTFGPHSAGFKSTNLTVTDDALGGSTTLGPFTGTGVLPAPAFAVSPGSQTFSARVGSQASGSVTISNSGTAVLMLGTITYTGPYSINAGSTCNNGASIAAGSSCTLTTTFTPTAAGAQNGSISITHNATGSPGGVTLNGTGTQSSYAANSGTLAFGNVQQGVSKALNFVVTNNGTATLNFSASPTSPANLSGAAASDYALSGSCSNATPVASGGGTCTLTLTFTPSALGDRSATLTIASDAFNSPLVINLTSTGVALPEPVVTFPTSDFPDTVIGQTSAMTRTITIVNNRSRDIQYSVANIADFNVSGQSCATHVVTGGGGTCTVTVQFVPTLGSGEGRRQGTLTFTFTGTGGDVDPSSVSGAVAGMALLPLSLSATSLSAAAVVGTPTTSSVVLTNRSSSALTLSSLAFSGAAPGDYSVDPTSTCSNGHVLVASANCTLVVRFAPAAAGTRNAVLTITHTALGSPQTVQLLGTATPAPQGRIALSATSLTFADTQLGGSTAQTVTIANSGNLALDFSGFTIAGTAAAEFSSGGTCAIGTPVPIGGQCTLVVTFAPAALGLGSANVAIASDASNGTATLALSGNGVPVPVPQVTLTPIALDFGNQTTGGLYPSRRIHLSNSGTANLAIASVVVAGNGFSNVSAAACPATLAPAAGCDIDITLLATSATAYNGTLTVTDNAVGSPQVAALRGNGVASALPVLVWSPAVTALDFGQVSAGSVSAVQSLTLSNQGPGGVTLTVLNAVGPDGASFSVVGGTCSLTAPLFEGQTCLVDVVFAPGSAGAKTASVQVASTGSFPPTVTLTGTGLAGPNPSLDVSTTTVTFEATRVGSQSLPQDVRLVSTGSGVVTVSGLAVDGPYAIQGTSCPALPFALSAGSQCTVTVTFRPTSEGSTGGTLRVTSDAAPAERDVALSGTGEGDASVTGGGCSIGTGRSLLDPSLLLMLLLAATTLLVRALHNRRAKARAEAPRQRTTDTEENSQ